jgi:YVTN family beta-propeller protein
MITVTRRLLLALALAAGPVTAGADPPRFSFTPRTVAPGGSLTLSGSGFLPRSTTALVLLADASVRERSLGAVPLAGGAFTRTLAVPADLPGGRYLVRVIDDSRQGAINLTGTLAVAPPASPWFSFGPATLPPGGTVAIFARGFDPDSTFAAVALVDSGGGSTLLGAVPLNGGAFFQALRVPWGLAGRSYRVVVRGSAPQLAENVSGPLTVARLRAEPGVAVGDYPVGAAVDPFRNRIWVPNAGDDTVSVIDGATSAVVGTVPVGSLPCAVGVDPLADRVYVANVNTHDLSILDAEASAVVATVRVGEYPCAVGVVPSSGRVFVGNYGSNTVTVVDGAAGSVVGTVALGGPPFGIGVNTATGRVYVATGSEDTVTVLDGGTAAILARIAVGAGPDAIGVNPVTNRVYAANYFGDTLTVIDGETHAVIATVPVGKEPSGVAVNPTTGRVFVGNYASNTVSVVDGTSHSVLTTVAVGLTPDGVAANPFTSRVYVVNSNTNDVSVIPDGAR